MVHTEAQKSHDMLATWGTMPLLYSYQAATSSIIVHTESPKLGYSNHLKAHVYTMELLGAFGFQGGAQGFPERESWALI